jgi:hypothetical protein
MMHHLKKDAETIIFSSGTILLRHAVKVFVCVSVFKLNLMAINAITYGIITLLGIGKMI